MIYSAGIFKRYVGNHGIETVSNADKSSDNDKMDDIQ
jgi:hypothetical protein